jgi:hypothetical protein
MGKNNHDTTAKMRAILAEVARDFDFHQFTVERFARWLVQQHGRPITFVPWRMPVTAFGVWLACEAHDYVFYEEDTAPIHQAHIQLHEMAHMLCGHSPEQIDSREIEAFLHSKGMDGRVSGLLLRSHHSNAAEVEAETLASLIHEQVLRYARLQGLTAAISPDSDFASYITAYIKGVEIA